MSKFSVSFLVFSTLLFSTTLSFAEIKTLEKERGEVGEEGRALIVSYVWMGSNSFRPMVSATETAAV